MNAGCYKNILPNIELLTTPTYSQELKVKKNSFMCKVKYRARMRPLLAIPGRG